MNEIRTPEELDALPAGRSAVLDREGDIWMSAHRRRWVTADARGDVTPEELLRRFGPLTLLHPLPDAPAPSAEGREALAGVIALAMADDDLSFVGVEHEDAADAALAWFAARQPTPSFTPAQRHAAESDEALFRVATRALFGTGEVIDIVLRALGVPVVSAEATCHCAVYRSILRDCGVDPDGLVPRG